MTRQGSLVELLRRARQRSVAHLLLHQSIFAAAAIFAAVIIILLTGTVLLSWYWLAPIAVISITLAVYRTQKRAPSIYVVAQRIDDKLNLADTLSTAIYFSDSDIGDLNIRKQQRSQAERLAEAIDVKRAIPFTRPRALYPAAGLALAAIGVFLVRYAVTGSLDSRTSLLKSAFDTVFKSPIQQAQLGMKPGDATQPGTNPETRHDEKNADFAGDPSQSPDQNSATDPSNKQDAAAKDQQSAQTPSENAQPQADPNQSGNPQNAQDSPSGKQNTDPSLLDKIREALNDVLSKMKPNSGESSRSQGQKNDSQPQATQQPQNSQSQDSNQGENQESANQGQQSNDGQNDSAANDTQSTKEQKNGIGNGEGDKANRQAEALKAMGKITELLGKRAENVSGEVMVEVGSTKQTLKTPLLQKQTSHSEAGSEIHRDQVPLMYEQFIQQYFEQIRKPAEKSPSK